jgi:hypothetical protein
MNKLSTVAKIRTAFSKRNLLATAIGAVKGGAIPFGTFALYHLEMDNDIWQAKGLIVLGGLVYSAKTVFGWCKQIFRRENGESDTLKALGWCVGIEGFMTCSSTFWLNCAALTLLILVNAVATGVSLAMEDEAAKSEFAKAKAEGSAQVDAEIAAVQIKAAFQTTREHTAKVQSASFGAVSPPGAAEQAAKPVSRKRTSAKRSKRSTRIARKDAALVN